MSALARLKNRYRASADPLRSERHLELVVVVLAVILLLQLCWAGARVLVAGNVEPVAPAADSVSVAEVPRPRSVNADDSAIVQSRPLFWSERRPSASIAAGAVAQESADERTAPKMKDVTLLGVFGSGRTGGAIVAVKGEQARVSVGEMVQDWRLQEVAANRAVFVSGGARDERELLPRVIAPPVDAAGDAIEAGAGQSDVASEPDDGEPTLSLLGSSRKKK